MPPAAPPVAGALHRRLLGHAPAAGPAGLGRARLLVRPPAFQQSPVQQPIRLHPPDPCHASCRPSGQRDAASHRVMQPPLGSCRRGGDAHHRSSSARIVNRTTTAPGAVHFAEQLLSKLGSGTDLGERSRRVVLVFDCEGSGSRPRTPCRPAGGSDAPSGLRFSPPRSAVSGDGAGHGDRCGVLGLAGVRRDRRRGRRGGDRCLRHGRRGGQRPGGRGGVSGL